MPPPPAQPLVRSTTEGGAKEVLQDLREALADGYKCHALQREPHLVLLDTAWYSAVLRPIVARWVVLWLGKETLGEMVLSRYLTSPLAELQEMRAEVEAALPP